MAKKKNNEEVITSPMNPEITESDLLYQLLVDNFNAIDPLKVLYTEQLSDGTFSTRLGGKAIPLEQLHNLQTEGRMIAGTTLWKMMIETLRNTAYTYMFRDMKTLEDYHYGKTLLYNVSIMEKILVGIEKAHINTPPLKSKPTTSYAKL